MKTILVVQQEPLVRGLFNRLLERGYNVVETTSAEGALDAARRSGKIDLLITDVALPIISGIELGSLLKAWMPRLHIILTADLLPEDWSADERAELSNFKTQSMTVLKMPFSPDDLRARVVSLIGLPESPLTAAA
ncbi:MAG TPA: response regulator [Bryobacteraceae bacterium]|jgi:CheY-like chemotaxis protein